MIETPLLANPLWRAEDLGKPLPETPHAVSVALPRWQDVVGYEEGEARVIDALQTGYPRFVYHPLVVKLFKKCEKAFAAEGEFCLVFPSEYVAEQCVAYVKEKSGAEGKVCSYQEGKVFAVVLPECVRAEAKAFWQHAGYIPSSRFAECLLNDKTPRDGAKAKRAIRERIASLAGEKAENVSLYLSGMAAVFAAHKLVITRKPHAKTIQLGFPYVDILKVQEKFGAGAHFVSYHDEDNLEQVRAILEKEEIAGVFCEVPGNPLLQTINLVKLSELLREYDVPLVVDDTVGTWENINLRPYADIIVTSLTKFFSGVGDVLGGSLVLNSSSSYCERFAQDLPVFYEDLLLGEDAIILEENSRDFTMRIKQMNRTAEKLADFLYKHPKVESVYYPKYVTPEAYSAIKKAQGGYGGLLSFVLKNKSLSEPIFDALEVDKGPSLGTNFTLACPYTLLAHYGELDFAEASGVSRYLIRVSVGLEGEDDLIGRFKRALAVNG